MTRCKLVYILHGERHEEIYPSTADAELDLMEYLGSRGAKVISLKKLDKQERKKLDKIPKAMRYV